MGGWNNSSPPYSKYITEISQQVFVLEGFFFKNPDFLRKKQ